MRPVALSYGDEFFADKMQAYDLGAVLFFKMADVR
jgi:hypothetical protein